MVGLAAAVVASGVVGSAGGVSAVQAPGVVEGAAVAVHQPVVAADVSPRVDDPAVGRVDGVSADVSTGVVTGGVPGSVSFGYGRHRDLVDVVWSPAVDVTGADVARVSLGGLDPSATYYVFAHLVGQGIDLTSGVTRFETADAPARPEPPVAVPATARASVAVSWLRPGDDGGAAITRYVVHSLPEAGQCTTVADSAGSIPVSCVVSGLDPQGSYAFVVEAFNNAGGSGQSVAGSPVVPGARSLPVAVRTPAKRVLDRRRARVRVTVGQSATGTVEVSVGSRLLCTATVRDGSGRCRGKVRGTGRRSLRTIFTGSGPDLGATGATIRRLRVDNVVISSHKTRVRGCVPRVFVRGRATKAGSVLTLARKHRGAWRAWVQVPVKKSGRWSATLWPGFGRMKVRAVGPGVSTKRLSVAITRPGRCQR